MIWKSIRKGTKAWLWSIAFSLVVPILFWASGADIYQRGAPLAFMLGSLFFSAIIGRALFNASGWDRD